MSTSVKERFEKTVNKRAKDPFDRLIFEQGLRAKHILADKKLNTLVVLLNNGSVLKVTLNLYPRLRNATQKQLDNWELIGGGIGIHWEDLDEDYPLKA